jgi:hypothetical protein
MLTPRDRRLLLDALRPPPGYTLDRAVGTSYTLDLVALLTAPLAFTFFDWEAADGRPTADPLALLQAVRRHADRITIFCQTGRIVVPRSGQALLSYLESVVSEVTPSRKGGIFHPKVWLLRFTAPDQPVRYRLLCLSRNLTFDRSWDTAVALDGELLERKRAIAANHPLADFIEALPSLAIRALPEETRVAVQQLADEVRRVRFELPEGFEEVAFWPLGIEGHFTFPFPNASPGRRMAIVSPFLSAGLLESLVAGRERSILVSRPESLMELAPDLRRRFADVFVLTDVEFPSADEPVAADAEAEPELLSGLHAKLFVMDDGWDASIWAGSANATAAAFSQNVEFLVELRGKKSLCGVDALLGGQEESDTTLRDMLMPFSDSGPRPEDSAKRALEERLDEARLALGRAKLGARVISEGEPDAYALLVLRPPEPIELPAGIEMRCRPISLPPGRAIVPAFDRDEPARFGGLTFDALTGFFAFELELHEGGVGADAGFVLNLPLEGAPEDRRERLLRSILANSDQVLRLMYLLLADMEVNIQDLLDAVRSHGRSSTGSATGGLPLLETLLKALGREPSRLDEVARLVDDLRKTPEGAALLPAGFDEIWDPIWRIREELRR